MKIKNPSYDLLTTVITTLKTTPGISIKVVNDNELIFIKSRKEIGTMNNKIDDDSLEFTGAEIVNIVKEVQKQLKETEEFFNEDYVKKTTIPDLLKDVTLYGGLNTNIGIFKELEKSFKEAGINKVYINKSIDGTTEILKNVGLFINPIIKVPYSVNEGYQTRTSKVVFKSFPHNYKTEDSLLELIGNGNEIKHTDSEELIPVVLYDYNIGTYYKDRNVITLHINPFLLKRIDVITKKLPEIFTELFREFKRIGVKKVSTEGIIRKNFIKNFMSSAQSTLNKKKDEIEIIARSITEYEGYLVSKHRDKSLTISNIEHLKRMIETGGEQILEDLDKLDKLPFLETYKLNNDSLTLVYKPTFLTIKDFKRNGVSYGPRKIYLGQITLSIKPSEIIVKSDVPMLFNNPHTHASETGHPCFGDGDANAKIRSFRTENRFNELSSMLWFWIQTHREEGAYIRAAKFYDDRLRQGLPVLDEKGNLIEINDKDRLASGEQEKLEKADNYKENIAKLDKYMEAKK